MKGISVRKGDGYCVAEARINGRRCVCTDSNPVMAWLRLYKRLRHMKKNPEMYPYYFNK